MFHVFQVWYFIPGEEAHKLEKLIPEKFPSKFCGNYMRHKNVLIPPYELAANGILFSKVSTSQDLFV